MSRDNLRIFNADLEKFLPIFVTMDDTWVNHFQPESKHQSKQWKHAVSPTEKKSEEGYVSWEGDLGVLGD